MRTLRVEGWRFIPHSYAMINQWQLLSLLQREDISLFVHDAPYFRAWTPVKGLFSEKQEEQLASIPAASDHQDFDATLRVAFPYDFSLSVTGLTAVFSTSEYRVLGPQHFNPPPDIENLAKCGAFRVITPSRWSREGFLRLGLRADQVLIVPHGVDIATFRPSSDLREKARRSLGLTGFTFCNVSSMSTNKGTDLLLRAFVAVAERYADIQLLMKGMDDLYRSRKNFEVAMSRIIGRVKGSILDRVLYVGNTLSSQAMGDIYRAVDIYVSPYLAEGFNLPVLEACACGTPVICTKGGSTDDFVDSRFAYVINSEPRQFTKEGIEYFYLQPDLDHLVQLMIDAIEGDRWRIPAGPIAAHHAANKYNWNAVVERLVDAVFPAGVT